MFLSCLWVDSLIADKVTTVSTPGETIDVLVTERGIAVNPRRKDLIERLKDSKIQLVSIEELKEIAERITESLGDRKG